MAVVLDLFCTCGRWACDGVVPNPDNPSAIWEVQAAYLEHGGSIGAQWLRLGCQPLLGAVPGAPPGRLDFLALVRRRPAILPAPKMG